MTIENFRGIQKLDLDFDDLTVLIGENNSGKTAVLEVLRLCLRELGPRRALVFDPFDFHLKDSTAEPQSSSSIRITITFSERFEGEWEDQLVGVLNRQKILQVGEDALGKVCLRVTCAYDAVHREFQQEWNFLSFDGQVLTGLADGSLSTLQRQVAYFYLAALRDAARNFDAKGPFWRPFLRDSKLTEEKKAEIETKLKELNGLVVSSHTSFEQVLQRLKSVQNVVPMSEGDVVAIEAVPGRMFDMLSKAQIHLGTSTGAKVPVSRHGEGTQSLAVLLLFSAFLDARPEQTPIVALEEPEAHLHPSAIRALWGIIRGIRGQKIVSTHSGDILSEVDLLSVRRLTRTASGVRAFRVPTGLLTPEETRKVNYHIRRYRGELLFARCWLLVEGESENWIYSAAARAINIDLHKHGIRIVEYSQSDVGLLIKVANALGIAWCCVVDDDSGRSKYEPGISANLQGMDLAAHVVFPYTSPEVHLLGNGYQAQYASLMPAQNLGRVVKSPEDPDYWVDYASQLPPKAKARGAALVAAEMERRGPAGVTKAIQDVILKAVAVSGGS